MNIISNALLVINWATTMYSIMQLLWKTFYMYMYMNMFSDIVLHVHVHVKCTFRKLNEIAQWMHSLIVIIYYNDYYYFLISQTLIAEPAADSRLFP